MEKLIWGIIYVVYAPVAIYNMIKQSIKVRNCEHRYTDGKVTFPRSNKYGETEIITQYFQSCRRCGNQVVTSETSRDISEIPMVFTN